MKKRNMDLTEDEIVKIIALLHYHKQTDIENKMILQLVYLLDNKK